MAARPIVTTTITAAHGDAEAPVGRDVFIAVAVGAVIAVGAVVADGVANTPMLGDTDTVALEGFKVVVLLCPVATETSSATRRKAIEIIVAFSIIGDSNTARACQPSSNKFLFLAMPFILSTRSIES